MKGQTWNIKKIVNFMGFVTRAVNSLVVCYICVSFPIYYHFIFILLLGIWDGHESFMSIYFLDKILNHFPNYLIISFIKKIPFFYTCKIEKPTSSFLAYPTYLRPLNFLVTYIILNN